MTMPSKETKRLAEELTGVAADSVSAVRHTNKPTKTFILITLSILFALCSFFGVFFTVKASESALDTASAVSANVVGLANGLIKLPNAYDEGKRKGLSAEDTEAYISNKMGEVGNLEIMDAGVKISDLQKIDGAYAGLYVSKGIAVFSVNLKAAEITAKDDTVYIKVNAPTSEIYIDEESTELLAEWQKRSFTGSTKDGYLAYLNSWNNSRAELEKAVENYDDLSLAAKDAARNQITSIVKACKGKDTEVVIEFIDIADNEESAEE